MGERRAPAHDSFALAHPVERVLLAATELVGNALRHAAPPVTLHLLRSARGWMVKVTDGDPHARPEQPEKVSGAAGKRGLLIVDALSEGTGWCPEGALKHVWAFVPDDPPERLVRTLRPGSYG